MMISAGKLDVLTIEDLWKVNIDGSLPILVEIYNPDIYWGEVTDFQKNETAYQQENSYLRICSTDVKLIYDNHTWFPCSMSFTQPEEDGTKIGTSTLTMSAIDARVKKILRAFQIPSKFKIAAMFSKVKREDSSKYFYKFVKLNVREFDMETASSKPSTASFNLTFNLSLQQNTPYDVATSDRVPAAGKND